MLFWDAKPVVHFFDRTAGKRDGDAAAIAWTDSVADMPTTEIAAVTSMALPGAPAEGGAPTVTGVVATPSSGVAFPGDTITLTLDMSAAVTVTGVPTLTLNDGGTATYSGGSGSSALTFTTVVTNSDRTVATLAITGVSLPPGAAVTGASGDVANLAGAVTTLTGLGVDPPTAGSYVDGSGGAPTGTPQLPNILSGYATRPAWQVAGVDYAVGVPSSTVLKDPTAGGILPAGATYNASNHTVTVTGNGVTLDGFDFSLHNGISLVIQSSNVTVQNCNFVVGSNQGSLGRVVDVTSSAGNVSFLYNEFNGNDVAVTAQSGALLSIQNKGTINFQYNYFHNTGGDCIDFGGGPQVENIEYNVFSNIGINTAHADTLQWYGSHVTSGEIGFNTFYQGVPQSGPGMGELVIGPGGSGATMSDMMVNNDTVIQAVAGSGNFTVGFETDPGTSANNVTFHDLYIDPTGAVGYTGMWLYPTGSYNDYLATPTTFSNITNMVTGTTYTALPHTQSYFVAPDPNGVTPSLNDIYGITASPGSGTEFTGNTVTFTMTLDTAYTVTGTPTLTLNDGGTATYSGGSGTSTLTFTYKVAPTDKIVSALAVTGVNLPAGASVTDAVGNAANLSSEQVTFSSLAVDPPCFCRGTHIATPDGEVPVERLRAGDVVTTLAGTHRRLRWVGFGRTLVTPRYRDHASVVVVRRDALADGVPHRDLYVTHGHSFYFDGVLIPAAHLVNHRSIAWVDDARVVEYYHLELDSHDVILAEGAAAESYRDDDNSQYFHNVADRPAARPLPSCAPVLHDHPTVKRIWRALHERAGRLDVALTEDPDLHLLADGERLDAERVGRRVWRFRLPRPVSDLRIVSRSAIPAMVGTEPDQRRLGVALRRIVLARRGARQAIGWDDARLTAGFHDPEPLDRHRWTDGEAALPLALLASLRAGATVELHVNGLLPYPVTEPSRHLPEGSPLRAGAEPSGAAVVVPASEVELARTERAERMRRRGYGIVHDPELRVLADDGEAIALHRFGERLCLAVPAGARRLRLASRQATPVDLDVATGDRRRLGVALAQLRLDGILVPLDDPRLLDGWHAPEPGFRWTNGAAVLDVTGIAVVELRLAAIPLPYVTPTPLDLPRQAAG